MAFVTIGDFSGPAPQDPNAEFRKLFTVPANQQDGLGSILNYCQKKAGFMVGSTDTTEFQRILRDEFSDIVLYHPTSYVNDKIELNKHELDEMIKNDTLPQEVLQFLPADKVQRKTFLEGGAGARLLTRSIIQFLNRMNDRDITLNIDEEHWVNTGFVEVVARGSNAYSVHRSRMAERADWLVDHLGQRDSLEEWCKRITSPSY